LFNFQAFVVCLVCHFCNYWSTNFFLEFTTCKHNFTTSRVGFETVSIS